MIRYYGKLKDDGSSPKVVWWALIEPDPIRWWQRIRWPWRKGDGYERISIK